MQHWIKNEKAQMLVIAFATAVGEVFMINPFSGDSFRIGLGVSIFLFLLLFSNHLNFVRVGALTGATSVLFQTGEWSLHTHSSDWIAGLQNNVAAGIYYVVYSLGMSRIRHRIGELPPLVLGATVAGMDLLSNEAELLVRSLIVGTHSFSLYTTFYLALVALVRSYFVTGLYSGVAISQMRSLHAEQQKRMEQMLTVGSGLYGEAFYLRKSMDTIERIAANSFELYQQLQASSQYIYGRQALGIAQQIHEVKKDSQRILAGLVKLVDSETAGEMSVPEMIRFAVKGNQQYAGMLCKRIAIESDIRSDLVTCHFIPLLTLLNNLVANAVESIDGEGTVHIGADRTRRPFAA
ncbi:hypothetical protein LJK87_43990 [Paenibacillus sp. P25]|nr:hypothetical protein LJK87_43990 [Paenibacillus sp. P25]